MPETPGGFPGSAPPAAGSPEPPPETTGGEDSPDHDEVGRLVGALTRACGDELRAVLFFGSRLVGSSPSPHSAADLFLVVRDYHAFYRQLCAAFPSRHGPRLLAALNHVLPPNVLAVRPADMDGPGAKCFVVRERELQRDLSPRPRDHFCRGRMSQQLRLMHAADSATATRILEAVAAARRESLQWVPLYLPERFSLSAYCRRMLEVSYGGEIRPESPARVGEVFETQRQWFDSVYGQLLEEAAEAGRLLRVEGGYALPRPPLPSQRLRWRWYFQRSRLRATLRWFKYVFTFDDWLDYILRKVERRAGIQIELTRAQRRWPFLLLWPRFFQTLWTLQRIRHRRQKEARQTPSRKERSG